MPMLRMRPLPVLLAALLLAMPTSPGNAQNPRETERKLQSIKRELDSVARERRKLEGEKGSVARELREADEQVGQSSRTLSELEARLAAEQTTLAQLQQRRDALQATLGSRRLELQRLLRAAYAEGGGEAPLKALLSPDRVTDAQRMLTYHRYLQRERAARIATLTAELRELDAIEEQVRLRQEELDRTRSQRREQLSQLELDRRKRVVLLAQLEQRVQDRNQREKALGRDAKGLEQLLKRLRVAAARAEAQRRAAAARAARQAAAERAKAREAAQAQGGATSPPVPERKPVAVAKTPAPQVGGLGWPVSGALLADFGKPMPDGHTSSGLLIGASVGAPVKAVADGTVVYGEWMTGYGLLLIVDHGNGYMSLYAHNDALLKDVGAPVKRGDTVSTVGSSGGHDRAALYFELRRNGAPVNPNGWLRR